MLVVGHPSRPTHHVPARARGLLAAAVSGLLAASAFAGGVAQASTALHPFIAHRLHVGASAGQLPVTSECIATFGVGCYTPAQYDDAYDLNGLHHAGIDGTGRTIVIVDAFGSPTIASDLHAFDQEWGLPDPVLKVIQPAGAVPPFDPNDSDMFGWALETSLDVEWSHAMAPGAGILLVETPISETEGVQGFPEIVKAENYVINHGLGDVISQSFGATENTFPSAASIYGLRSAYINAYLHHVTVLGASGDSGATDYELNLSDLYPYRVNSWPSSDPLVTSVGGTQLTLDDNGNRLAPDVVWNDGYGAGGGGVSAVFARPGFQAGVRRVVDGSRGTPDISMSAAVDGSAWVYITANPDPAFAGWWLVGGTSEASPLFAGIVAMADQLAGHRLGYLNDDLYQLAWQWHAGIVDVTSGNNSFGPFTNSDGNTYTVTGYNARPGYDLASGLGTVDGARFVRALAKLGGGGSH
jgi:subtilase family serine protease